MRKSEDNDPPRPIRADAQRSTDALIAAARTVFARAGVDAPVREIATEAGVGIGTLYRNFPKRADLITAVFRAEIDACADAAPALAADHPPFEALQKWFERYVSFLATKRGFASALYSGDPTYETLPPYVRKRFEPAIQSLLSAAEASGDVHTKVEPMELMRAVARLATQAEDHDETGARQMVTLLLNGLRFSN